jgi:tRNA U34 2-thiouridine synthase MnmA/TrmU
LKSDIKAIALISSGLDSLLSAKIIHDLGIQVYGLHCFFRFDPLINTDRFEKIQEIFQTLGIPVIIKDITESYMKMFLIPDHGYGSGVNPCIDCKILMLRFAKKEMDKIGAQFLITGEVVGQRPMSQMKPTLFHIEKVTGLKGTILRPLSAKLLPETYAEEKGWIDRNKLFDHSGRSRKMQIALTKQLGIINYNQPAGGCILTDPQYARRTKVLFNYRHRNTITLNDMQLLRLGRHFWPNKNLHIIVGRDEKDNQAIESYTDKRWSFEAVEFPGPLVVAEGIQNQSDIQIAAGLTARYCGKKRTQKKLIKYSGDGRKGEIWIQSIGDSYIEKWRI